MVKYTDLTRDVVMNAVLQVFPDSVVSLLRSILNQVYRHRRI